MLLEPVDPNERFRSRRRQARRRRAIRRTAALAVVALAAAGTTLGARFLTERDAHLAGAGGGQTPTTQAAPTQPKPQPRPYPDEIRGVHVTMALASVPGKIDEYLSLTKHGLNALELDVKDENGEVGFRKPKVPLAREVDAAKGYYDPVEVAQKAHAAGVYLIGRIVCFEDPTLTQSAPRYAIRTTSGGVWTTVAGLGWANPYDKRVWDYNVQLGIAAAKAGFDEIQFDYVRFPTDGDLSAAVFPGKTKESKTAVITSFAKYAGERLKPLGVRVSADVFGLSATRNMGIGQRPKAARRLPRHDLPDGLSLPLRARGVQPARSERAARPHGRPRAPRLRPAADGPRHAGRSLAPGLLARAHVHAGGRPGPDRGRP